MGSILNSLFIATVITLSLITQSCEKPPTQEEAKRDSYDRLVSLGYTDVMIHDHPGASCDPAYRYCFAFSAIESGGRVTASIYWNEYTHMFITIDSRDQME